MSKTKNAYKRNFPNQQFDSIIIVTFASLLALPFVCFNWLVKTHLFANCYNLWVVFLLYLPSYFSYIYFHHLSDTVFYTVFLFDSLHSELFLDKCSRTMPAVFLTLVLNSFSPWGNSICSVPLCNFFVCSFLSLYMSHE